MGRRRYTEAEFRATIADPTVRTMADLCRGLGLVPRGANYETLRRYARQLGIDLGHLATRAPRLDFSVAELRSAVAQNHSMASTIRQLGGTPHSGHYRRLRQEIAKLGLSTAHWTGQGWRKGRTFTDRRRPIEHYLVEGRLVTSAQLRHRLLEEGLKPHRCEICEREEWNGEPIPLELDHINGDRWDNRLENLSLVCPNCHALTPTYRGRNIGRYGQPAS